MMSINDEKVIYAINSLCISMTKGRNWYEDARKYQRLLVLLYKLGVGI